MEVAKKLIDELIDQMECAGDEIALVENDLWEAFIIETGCTPQPINGNDHRIIYRDVELRPSAVL
jgi:hypothetical protein